MRDQLEASNKKLSFLEIQLRESKDELVPLKGIFLVFILEKVRNLEAELDVRRDEIEALHQDNSRWKLRTQQILEKYEVRI